MAKTGVETAGAAKTGMALAGMALAGVALAGVATVGFEGVSLFAKGLRHILGRFLHLQAPSLAPDGDRSPDGRDGCRRSTCS